MKTPLFRPYVALFSLMIATVMQLAPAARAQTALPQPYLKYTFSDLTSGSIPNATVTVNTGTGVGTTSSPSDYNIGVNIGTSTSYYGIGGANGSGPFNNGRSLILSTGIMNNGGPQPRFINNQTDASNFTTMTITGWYNADVAPVNGAIFVRNTATNQGWQITWIGPKQMRLVTYDGTGVSPNFNSNANLFSATVGTWQFFALTWTSASGAQWYAGTETSAPVADSFVAGIKGMAMTTASKLQIGYSNNTSGAFQGKLADLRVYNTVLTSDQITAIYNEARPNTLPQITSFAPSTINIGGAVAITGSNFMVGGASVVTDVRFDTISASAVNYSLSSDTLINVTAVPAGIPGTGNITVVTTSGSAVSATQYALPGAIVIPQPLIKYDAQGSTTKLINSGTLGTAFDITLRTTAPLPAIGTDGTGPANNGRSIDLTNATMGSTSLGVQSAASTALQAQPALTITGWFKPSAGSIQPNGTVFLMRNGNSAGWALLFQTPPDGTHLKPALNVYGTTPLSTAFPSDNTSFTYDNVNPVWQFFAVTWDPATGAQWYAGTPASIAVAAGSKTGAQDMITAAASLNVGAGGTGGAFQGMMADLRVYNSVLSAAQVEAIRQQALPATLPLPPPTITIFTPTVVTVGGTMTVTGSNFTDSGTSLITNILFDTVSTGAANFTVASGTQINVTVIPSGIPAGGYVKLLATTGSAVSSGTYSLAVAPSSPVAPTMPADISAGSSVTFNASASGLPASTYTWKYSADNGSTWLNITNLGAADYTLGTNGATLTLNAVTVAMLGYQFKYTADNGVGTPVDSASVTLTFTPPAPTIDSFAPTSIMVGGTTTITGANYIISGTSVVTNILFNTIAAGAANFTVAASGTQINVTAIPSGIPASGYISVLATTGTAVSTGTYTLVAPPSAPVAPTIPPAGVAAGSNVTLTASASGLPAPAYTWKYSTDNGVTWLDITNLGASNYTLSGTGNSSLTLNVVTSAMAGYQFKYTANNGVGASADSAPVTLTITAPLPVVTTFAPAQISIGGTVAITGSNFMSSGTSIVTNVFFGTVPTGITALTVNSGTQITVNAVPSGAFDNGYITVITTSGSDTSATPYTLVAPNLYGLPAPFLKYTFNNVVSGTIVDGAFMANSGTGGGSAYDLKVSPNGGAYALSGTFHSGPFAGGRMIDLGQSTGMNGTAPTVTIAANQTAASAFDAMTVTGWFNNDAPPILNATVMRQFGANSGWQVIFTGTQNQMRLNVGDGTTSTSYNSTTTAFSSGTNQWRFYAVTWTKTGGAQWYVGDDGTAPVAAGGDLTPRNMASYAISFVVGRQNSTSGAFKGKFADMRVYASSLTPAQIAAIYDEAVLASGTLPPPVVASFTPDLISSGANMTITGYNFVNNGTSVVTDVRFGNISTGAANFTVNSGTQITINSIPAGITYPGYITVLTTAGSGTSTAQYDSSVVTLPDPVVRYTFTGSSTTKAANVGTLRSAYDLALGAVSGNASAIALLAPNASGPGGFGQALDNRVATMNGAAPQSNTPSATTLEGDSKMTFTGWFKSDGQPINGAMIMRNSSGTPAHGFIVQFSGTEQLQLSIYNPAGTATAFKSGANSFPSSTQTFDNQAWHFFAITWDATTGATWYAGSDTVIPTAAGATTTAVAMGGTTPAPLSIGYSNTGSGGYKGQLADLRIYKGTTLTLNQIKAIRNQALTNNTDGDFVLPYPAAWDNDADTRRATARSTYLSILERTIRSQDTLNSARIAAAYINNTSLGRVSLYYAYGLVYRASLNAPSELAVNAAVTRDGYIAIGRQALDAILNTIATGSATEHDNQVSELQFCLGATVRLYNMLDALGAISAADKPALLSKLGDTAQALYNGNSNYNREYGSFNRAATAADGFAAASALLTADSRRTNWLQYANAVWTDWLRTGISDTFEDARGYNGLWVFATFNQAQGLGASYLAQMKTATVATAFSRFANIVAQNGTMPDYGDCYWDHGIVFWLCAAERLGQFYGRADFLENGLRIADFINRNPGMTLESCDALADACAAVAATPPNTTVTRPGAIATTRTGDYASVATPSKKDTFADKLYLRTGNTANSSYAAFNLHDHGYHGHDDSGALGLYTVGASVLLHSQGREDVFANQEQSVWAVRPGDNVNILTTSGRHPANQSTRWIVNHRFTTTYTGQPALDIAKVTTMFFRAQNDGATPIDITVTIESVTGVKPDGTTVQVSNGWSMTRTGLASGGAIFVTSTNFSPALDLSPYDYLIVQWKSTHPDYTQQFGFNGSSCLPTGVADGRPLTATLRTTAGATTLDSYATSDTIAPKGGVTRIMTDSAGRQIVHDRDVRLRNADGSLFVLDTFQFTESGSYTVGPVWHVQNLVSKTATSVVTRDVAQIDNGTSKAAEVPMPLRFDFATSDTTNAVLLTTSTYAANGQPQMNHFSPTVTGSRAAGDKVSIFSVLRPGTANATGANASDVPGTPALMQVGSKYANYTDNIGQLSIGLNPPAMPITIVSFTPTLITPGGSMTISGFGFRDSNGVATIDSISIGEKLVSITNWTINSDKQISITLIPTGIPDTGYIKLIYATGTAVSADPYSLAKPTITNITPTAFYQDGSVRINGTNLTGATSITIGGVAAASWTVASNGTYINVVLPPGIPATGTITVTTSSGTVTSTDTYTMTGLPIGTPDSVIVDANNNVFVADSARHDIKEITAAGVVLTFAGQPGISGNNGGYGVGARFNTPRGITIGADGNFYVADTSNSNIKKITPSAIVSSFISATTGRMPTWQDAQGGNGWMYQPVGIAPGNDGNLYVADSLNHAIRKVAPDGTVSTLAGTPMTSGTADGIAYIANYSGTATIASFNTPKGVAVYHGAAGNTIYVADTLNHTIRAITPDGHVITIAGKVGTSGNTNGTGTAARFNNPIGLIVDADGFIYVADNGNHVIREVDIATGTVGTYAGVMSSSGNTNGPRLTSKFNKPSDVAFDSAGRLYIADSGNGLIRVIGLDDQVTTLGITGSTTVTPLPPASNTNSGSAENHGGGAPSLIFLAALASLATLRAVRRR